MLVWPSELYFPYQFYTDSTDKNAVANITSCQYDDGSTVYDIKNGGTVTSFDTANQIGATAPGGQRISAQWSTGKPAGIEDNPFSLLLTIVERSDDLVINEFIVSETAPDRDFSSINAFCAARQGDVTRTDRALLKGVFTANQLAGSGGTQTGNLEFIGEVAPTGSNFADMTRFECDVFFAQQLGGSNSSYIVKNVAFYFDGNDNFQVRSGVGCSVSVEGIDIRLSDASTTAKPIEPIIYSDSQLVIENISIAVVNRDITTPCSSGSAKNAVILCGRGGTWGYEACKYDNSILQVGVRKYNSTANYTIMGTSTNSGGASETAGVGNIIDANVLSYFTDISSSDVRDWDLSINETGHAALKGKGWNGSDVCSHLYINALTTVTHQLEPVYSQQLSITTTVEVETSSTITTVYSEQLSTTSTVELALQQNIAVINTEQHSTTTLIDVTSTQALGVINTEQLSTTTTVNLTLSGTNEITLQPVFSEQHSTTTLVSIANASAIAPIATQQLSTSATVDIGVAQHIPVVNTEQRSFTTVESLSIINTDNQFSLDASHIRIIRTTPDITIISTTPIITILES